MRKYYRCTNTKNAMSDFGHAMFAEKLEDIEHYGKFQWVLDAESGININDIEKIINDAWFDDCNDLKNEYIVDSAIELFNTNDIVNSANGFDNSELIQWFWDKVASNINIDILILDDGAICWDSKYIKNFKGV